MCDVLMCIVRLTAAPTLPRRCQILSTKPMGIDPISGCSLRHYGMRLRSYTPKDLGVDLHPSVSIMMLASSAMCRRRSFAALVGGECT